MMLNCWRGWDKHFGNERPELLHGHDYLTYYLLSLYMPKTVKKIFTVHDPLAYHQKMLGRLSGRLHLKENMMIHIEQSVYNRSDKVHVISNYTHHRILHYKKQIECKVVPNWVDVEKFNVPQSKILVRNKLGITCDAFIIYTLRALEPRMGIENLIRGFNLIQDKIPNSQLVIGGKGPLTTELKQVVSQLGLEKKVKFLGYVPDEDIVPWYQAADVVIIPSLDGEGFGLPVIEAMACGTPVLATPICALPEVLSGVKGRLFSGTTPQDIAFGLYAYYQTWKQDGISHGKERQYVLDHFTEEIIIPSILEDYQPSGRC